MDSKPINYEHAYQSPSGSRWIVASNPAHWNGTPEVLEINDEGEVTLWEYCGRTSPCIGSTGTLATLKPGTTLKHVTNTKEREMVAHKERLIAKGKAMLDLRRMRAEWGEG